MLTKLSFIYELTRPKIVRIVLALWAFSATYDGVANQYGLHKIPALWGMTESLLPWWGWLLVAQAVFVYALFEYVRRNMATPQPEAAPAPPAQDAVLSQEVRTRLQALESAVKDLPAIRTSIASFESRLKPLEATAERNAVQARREKMEEMVRTIEKARDYLTPEVYKKSLNARSGMRPPGALTIEETTRTLQMMGIPQARVTEIMREADAQVRSDPIQWALSAQDIGVWDRQEDKQAWVRRVKAFDALIGLVRNLEQERRHAAK
jgi:hypothetical protein